MHKYLLAAALTLLSIVAPARAQYPGWKHSGSVWILTTPEGADLPAAAIEKDFPLLVRLNKESFNFSEAAKDGADLRCSSNGEPVAYQIEAWDATQGVASVWVRVPEIRGNTRQELKLLWGKADAKSESNGSAVFNESNGFLSVLHLSDSANPVKDDAGSLTPTDHGTTATAGVIGGARRFEKGQGIQGGDDIKSYPVCNGPHTTQAWIKADGPRMGFLAWGDSQRNSDVVLQVAHPARIRSASYHSGSYVLGTDVVPWLEWCHVAYVNDKEGSRVYVDGRLDAVSSRPRTGPSPESTPVKMWVGGWRDQYGFEGAIDEVRISNVARSADWIKLEYANQNALQTLVGSPVQPGSEFAVAQQRIEVAEGKTATVTAKAGGAQKVTWTLERDGEEQIVAVDRFGYTFNAGRVPSETSCTLRFNAVYADGVKTIEIPITIANTIPEPVFTLQAPKQWNGRDTIEVVPEISNLAAMQAAGVGELRREWSVSGGATIREVTPEKLILKHSQYTGPIVVELAINNGGPDSVVTAPILVTEPENEPWVMRTPEKDEQPQDNQFYARDDTNEGTLSYNGTLDTPADAVFLKLYAEDALIKTDRQKLGADKAYAFTMKLKPGLIHYKVEFGTKTGDTETLVHTVGNLVCGDAYLIQGQSNALATDTRDQSPPQTHDWIRSYDLPRNGESANRWYNPVWRGPDAGYPLGWWGMELAKRLVKSQQMPICIINGAVGGTRIDQHLRSETNPLDMGTIYGRTLCRVQQARLTHGIRAVIWHQGESDQGAQGLTDAYGWTTYQQSFVALSAAWKEDFPNIQYYYTFQIWPNACSMGGSSGDMVREVQRTLPEQYSNMRIMSTLGIRPGGGCHYPLTGWSEFARLLQPQIEQDHYGLKQTESITPPNLKRAYYTSGTHDAIALEFDQPVVWSDSLGSEFYPDGAKDRIAAGTVNGNTLTLTLKEPSTAEKISYLDEMNWSEDNLLQGANGIAALTFCDVPIESNP